jgi:hypothetical protein
MAADASGNRRQFPDPMARLHPPAVTEKLVQRSGWVLVRVGRAGCGKGVAQVPHNAALRIWNWRLGRVYFLAFLNPSRGQPDPALTARLASLASVGESAIEVD